MELTMAANSSKRKSQIMDALDKANAFRRQKAADKKRINSGNYGDGLKAAIELLESRPAVPPWWFTAPVGELLTSVKYVGKHGAMELCLRAAARGANLNSETRLGRLTTRQRTILAETLQNQLTKWERTKC